MRKAARSVLGQYFFLIGSLFGSLNDLVKVNICLLCCIYPGLCSFILIFSRYGSRNTCIFGSLIAASSMFLSSYCSSFISLFVTYGLLAGIGLGFVYVPAVVAVGEYFRIKLSFATGEKF